MSDTQTLEQAVETPTPQAAQEAAAEETPAAETAATEEAESPAPPRYLVDGDPVEDEYALLDHPKLKPHMERQERRLEEKYRGQYEEQFKQATQKWETTKLHDDLSTELGRLRNAVSDSDVEGAEKVLARLDRMTEPYSKTYQETLRIEGQNAAAGTFYAAIKGQLSRRESDEFEDFIERKQPNWPEALDEFVKLKVGEQVKSLKAEIQKRDDTIERMKAEGRTGQGPNLAPSTPGGGGLYSQMTREQRAALSPEERDALVAREIGA